LKDAEGYERTMSLTINGITSEDYGHYKCQAVNPLGRDAKYTELGKTVRVVEYIDTYSRLGVVG